MKVVFKKKVMDLKKKEFFPLGEEVYITEARYAKICQSVKTFGNIEDYLDIIKGYDVDAKNVEDINTMQE